MQCDAGLVQALERLGPHDHLCSIYENPEEHFAVAVPFIRIGLERHEKCLYITEADAIDSVRAAMSAGGIDVAGAVASGALQLLTKDQTYMRQGCFDPDWMFTYWSQAADEARRQGSARCPQLAKLNGSFAAAPAWSVGWSTRAG